VDEKRRYVMVGTGMRAMTYIDALAGPHSDTSSLVALCDSSSIRMAYHADRMGRMGNDVPVLYSASGYERMLEMENPDGVIICSVDSTHDQYIIPALNRDLEVIVEKPLTTDSGKVARIHDALTTSHGRLAVTFNLRWADGPRKVRRLIEEGGVGQIHHIHFEHFLNLSHGADYFRRWHSDKNQSGGLLVHKSTHHFDLVNWWLDELPRSVFCHGALRFYGESDARTPAGNPGRFHLDLHGNEALRELYLKAESETGYIRNQDVFRNGIDIEDTLSVLVRYRSGALLNYSLIAYSPYEGFRVSITGDKGRIEYRERHGHPVDAGSGGEVSAPHWELEHTRPFSPSDTGHGFIKEGGHGGADPLLMKQLFGGTPGGVDPEGRAAGFYQGAASMLIGAAANESIQTGLPVSIDSLFSFPHADRLRDFVQ